MLCLDPIPDCYWEPVQLKTWAVPYRTTGGKEPALTIAAVGAVYQPAYGFSANDRGWLDDTIAVLTQRGTLDMARDVHVAPVNFLCGRNAFRLSGVSAKVFVCCLVCDPPESRLVGRPRLVHPSRWTSPRHRQEGIWGASADRMGAQTVVTYSIDGMRQEIAARHFEQGGFYQTVASDVLMAPGEDDDIPIRRDILVRSGKGAGQKSAPR